MVTGEQLLIWRQLADAASPAPWTRSEDDPGDIVIWGAKEDWTANVGNWARQHDVIDPDKAARQWAEFRDAADGAFIAAAREAVPALIAEVGRLRGWLRLGRRWSGCAVKQACREYARTRSRARRARWQLERGRWRT